MNADLKAVSFINLSSLAYGAHSVCRFDIRDPVIPLLKPCDVGHAENLLEWKPVYKRLSIKIMRLKSWESPRRGRQRNHKSRQATARLRQLKKQRQQLRQHLKAAAKQQTSGNPPEVFYYLCNRFNTYVLAAQICQSLRACIADQCQPQNSKPAYV
jgi:hypothetical protein